MQAERLVSRIVAVVIFGLMLSCLYGSFQLFSISTAIKQIPSTDEISIITYILGMQQTVTGLSALAASLSIIGSSFVIYLERKLADKSVSGKEMSRRALSGILVFQPVMLFLLYSPFGELTRAMALVHYDAVESVSLAMVVGTSGLWLVPIWALITIVFVSAFLKIMKAL